MHLCSDTRYSFADGTETTVRVLVADVQDLMNDEAAQTQALGGLSPARREKALACKNPRSRALSIGVALLLDQLLHPLGLRERDMTYVEGEHGKPTFIDAPLHFNLSHSGHLVAAAMGPTSLGLDIQRITHYRPELVRRLFGAEERAVLAACTTETEREHRFTELWCRAEAYAKATGRGLQWPVPTPSPTARFIPLTLPDDYCGCLCLLES
jgi:4'-phosphopantetheinyl transferase